MCRKTQDQSKQSLLERCRKHRRLHSRNATTTSLPNGEAPSLTFSSSSTLQGAINTCLLRARLTSSDYPAPRSIVDSESLDSNIEENDTLAIERVVEQWLKSVRQRLSQN
jgi:hypothetical protein